MENKTAYKFANEFICMGIPLRFGIIFFLKYLEDLDLKLYSARKWENSPKG